MRSSRLSGMMTIAAGLMAASGTALVNTGHTIRNSVAHSLGRPRTHKRRVGSNQYLPQDQQDRIIAAAQAKRGRKMNRPNGWNAS